MLSVVLQWHLLPWLFQKLSRSTSARSVSLGRGLVDACDDRVGDRSFNAEGHTIPGYRIIPSTELDVASPLGQGEFGRVHQVKVSFDCVIMLIRVAIVFFLFHFNHSCCLLPRTCDFNWLDARKWEKTGFTIDNFFNSNAIVMYQIKGLEKNG